MDEEGHEYGEEKAWDQLEQDSIDPKIDPFQGAVPIIWLFNGVKLVRGVVVSIRDADLVNLRRLQ